MYQTLLHYKDMVQIFSITMMGFAVQAAGLLEFFNAHPAVASAIVAGLVAFAVKFIDKWLDGRNKTINTADEVLKLEQADKQKQLEAEREERKTLKEEQRKLLEEKENWWKAVNDRLKAEHFDFKQYHRQRMTESREVNHAAVNELMRMQNIILGMQREMILAGLPVPAVTEIQLTRFMIPIWEREKEEHEHENDINQHEDVADSPPAGN